MAFARPLILEAVWVRKCSTMISAFWARLTGEVRRNGRWHDGPSGPRRQGHRRWPSRSANRSDRSCSYPARRGSSPPRWPGAWSRGGRPRAAGDRIQVPKSSRVRALGVAVKAKNERFYCRPRAPTALASASSTGSIAWAMNPASSASATVSSCSSVGRAPSQVLGRLARL